MPDQACRNALLNVPREQGTHAGLLLARFLRIPVKDTDGRHPEERRKLYTAAQAACQAAGDIYKRAFDRRLELLQTSVQMLLSVQGRSIVGLGGENILETGITLHHTYGVPMIPGTALKGLAAHYCDQVWGVKNAEFKKKALFCEAGQEKKRSGHYFTQLFGTTDDSGHIIFHDAWITPESLTTPNQGLILDVMTPHHGDYYMADPTDNFTAPTDFDSPNPVTFLSVAGAFHVAVSCDVPGETGKKWAYLAFTLLLQALSQWGIGGKTNAGYGRMVDSSRINESSSLKQQETTSAPSRPRFKAGDRVTAKRVEDPRGKGRMWFQADDELGGRVTHGAEPQTQVGGTVPLWIVSASKDSYNFSSEPPPPFRQISSKGPKKKK